MNSNQPRFLLLLAIALALPPMAQRSRGADAPLQGAAFLKTDILGVFAHPDDETGMAASLAHYAHGEGKIIAHAYVTRGEGGGNMVGTQAGAALGILREAELRECLRILGVRHAYFLDQLDFFYTESYAATLRKWDKEAALEKLVRLVRSLRPEIMLTMNPAPNPGQHGHHQAAGVLATEAFAAAADPSRFPSQLADEGLETWQARKLFYGGVSGLQVTTINTTQPLPDGRLPADIAGEALSQHRSQGFGGFIRSPWLRRPQGFTLVKSVIAPEPNPSDLFAGLPAHDPVQLNSFAAQPLTPVVAFVPRPAIVNYLKWTAEQGISHLAATFPADLPVVAGEANTLQLEVHPDLLAKGLDSLRIEAPDTWKARLANRPTTPERSGMVRLPVIVEPPADARGDSEIHAHLTLSDSDETGITTATARLHPVPRASVPGSPRVPALDGSLSGWEGAKVLTIGTNQLWQGRTDSPADASATVHLLHHDHELWIDVEVQDDVVVSNIQPDDIKGHWRSDSVEICLDPAAGAEDTTGCFKIGIFPFDSTGKVRAARDADARQGPVEVTAPGLRLASVRTPTGYRIQAVIPFRLVTGTTRTPDRLGFNVLIYDGDKADAAPGENINESRLAWSPRSGIQGRPEDWGRIDLD
jgi:LmbE family N-acetylglucosaminyl deacetylase